MWAPCFHGVDENLKATSSLCTMSLVGTRRAVKRLSKCIVILHVDWKIVSLWAPSLDTCWTVTMQQVPNSSKAFVWYWRKCFADMNWCLMYFLSTVMVRVLSNTKRFLVTSIVYLQMHVYAKMFTFLHIGISSHPSSVLEVCVLIGRCV